MKYIFYLATSFTFFACNYDKTPDAEFNIENSQNITQEFPTQNVDTLQKPVLTNTLVVPPTTTNTAVGLNPAHGQPGHRCDISVGAPLNSKPTVQPNPTTSNTTVPNTKVPTPSQININPQVQAVAAGMNPAHGQPGHRCDISVGAPLNSKPVAAAPSLPAEQLLPVKQDSSKNH